MNKFLYSYDPTTKKTSRLLAVTYPRADLADTDIGRIAKAPAQIIKQIKLSREGVIERPFIITENKWWELQSSIQRMDDAIDELTTNLDSLSERAVNELFRKYDVDAPGDIIPAITAKRDAIIIERTELESGITNKKSNNWLMGYRGVPNAPARPVLPAPLVPDSVINSIIVHQRNERVRDNESTIADLAKMNSLLFSMVSAVYNAMPTADKANIPAEKKALIDYATAKFAAVQTRADRQLQQEGTALIDRLLARESSIADIIDNTKKLQY